MAEQEQERLVSDSGPLHGQNMAAVAKAPLSRNASALHTRALLGCAAVGWDHLLPESDTDELGRDE
jgi:hypothetical protein